MPKDKNDPNEVSDLLKNLRSQFGVPEPEEPKAPEQDEAPQEDEELEQAEEVEAEASPLPENRGEAPTEAEKVPTEEPAFEKAPEEPEKADLDNVMVEAEAFDTIEDAPVEPTEASPAEDSDDDALTIEELLEKDAKEDPADEPTEAAQPLQEELEEPPAQDEQDKKEERGEDLFAKFFEKEDEAPDESEDEVPDEDEALSEDEIPEEDETPEEDEVSEDQIAFEMPESAANKDAEPAPKGAPEPAVKSAPAPAPKAPAQPPAAKPLRESVPVGKAVASEQIKIEHMPVLPVDPSARSSDEEPSVEFLERSSPDLSSLSDEERLKKSNLSEEDIRMMLEFGYEDDLRRVLGPRTVRNIKYPGDALERTRLDLCPFAYTGKEYGGSPEERKKTLALYQKEKSFLIWRMIVVSICTLALLFLDVWAKQVVTWPHPALPSICGALILLLAAAFSHRALTSGYRSLIYFAPTPHSIPALFFPIAIVLDLWSAFLTTSPFPAVNFPVALLFLLSALGDVFRFTTEKRTFLVVSSAEAKIAIDPYVRHKKKIQGEDRILCIIDDAPDSAEYRVRTSQAVTGFFRRCGNLSGSVKSFSLILSLSFGLALAGGLFAWIFSKGVLQTLSAFVNILLFAAPVSSIFAFFYPARLVSGELAQKRVAVVGEESIDELKEKHTLLFSDNLVFTSGSCSQTPMSPDADSKQDLRLAGILFRKLGGVPAQVSVETFPASPDPAVSILRIREDGVEALIDNRYHVLAGSRDYLVKCGIRCPAEPKTKTWQSVTTSELLIAIDDVVKLRYAITYSEIESFKALLERLRKVGTEVGVFTYDPSLNNRFLQKFYGDEIPPVLVKPGVFDTEADLTIADSAVVALGEESSKLADAVEAAAKIRRARKLGFRVSWIASLLGTAFATICILFDRIPGLAAFSAFHIAVLLVTWGVQTAQFKHKNS